MSARVVAVIGGGAAGLMAAETLATDGVRVVLFERMASVGRKFLLAGRGGLNLTHSENLDAFLTRYRPQSPLLTSAIRDFPPSALRAWADGLGQETFVGSSGRVFPTAFRAAPLLRAWIARLHSLGVEINVRHTWRGWPPRLTARDGVERAVDADALVIAAGGASWPRTGSDGLWVKYLDAAGVGVAPLRGANVGVAVEWTADFLRRFAGEPLKDVRLSVNGATSRGDAVVTYRGLEGGAVYAIGAHLRDEIDRAGAATLLVDLRPDLTRDELSARLARRRAKSTASAWLRSAGLSPIDISLMRDATGNTLPDDSAAMAALAKAVPLPVAHVATIDRAISSAGGIHFDEIDDRFMLRAHPGVFVAGEMLDWEAPTGGYLLQGCFSTGVAAARGAMAWMETSPPGDSA